MRILGIDPGLNRTGYGIIDADGDRLRCVASGVIVVPAGALPARLGHILIGLREVIAAHGPGRASVEEVFVNVNPRATLLLGQARGAAICAAVEHGLEVREHAALKVKQAVVGTGRATKEQVQAMVQRLLGLAAAPATDAADALACAICEAHADRLSSLARRGGLELVTGARRGRRSREAWRQRVEG